jgi:hypothetical protein
MTLSASWRAAKAGDGAESRAKVVARQCRQEPRSQPVKRTMSR